MTRGSKGQILSCTTVRAALWSSNLDIESRTNKGQSSVSSSTYYSRFPILILLTYV